MIIKGVFGVKGLVSETEIVGFFMAFWGGRGIFECAALLCEHWIWRSLVQVAASIYLRFGWRPAFLISLWNIRSPIYLQLSLDSQHS